jgi:hypothetical protein
MMNNEDYNINNGNDNNTRTTLSKNGANATDHSTNAVHRRKNPVEKEEEE